MIQKVKILITNDLEEIPEKDQVWHLVDPHTPDPATFCFKELVTIGDSHGVTLIREYTKGSLTCEHCISNIKDIQRIKL